MKSATRSLPEVIIFLGLLALWRWFNQNLDVLPALPRWLVLGPYLIIRWVAQNTGLSVDHAVLASLIIGGPLLIVYWLAAYRLILRLGLWLGRPWLSASSPTDVP